MPKSAKERGSSAGEIEAAISSKNVQRVRELIAAGKKPNAEAARQAVDDCIKAWSSSRMTEKPIFGRMPTKKEQEKAAADAGVLYEITEALLEAGAPVPELLCSAARSCHAQLALLLIRKGADVDYDPPMGTPLENAVSAGSVEIVEALIKAGADVQHQGIKGTLLTRAVEAGHIELARHLLRAGLDVNTEPRFGASALMTAVTEGKADFVRMLLEAGASVNQKGTVVCGEFGKPEVKEEGMFRTTHIPNPPLARDATALIVATRRQNATIAEQLVAAGADVNATDADGFSAIYYALQAKHARLIDLLKGAGATLPKYAEGSREAAWIAAAKAGDCARLRAIIADGVDVNVTYATDRDENGEDAGTALKYAALNGRVEAVKLLLASGAKVDEKFGEGYGAGQETALMHAAKAGQMEVARLLLNAKASVRAKDRGGNTVLHYAAEGGQVEMIRLLIEHGATVDAKKKDGPTPLMAAANEGHVEAITELIRKGADPNACATEDGMTPLWYAASNGHLKAVKALLDAGANPGIGGDIYSPLEAASSEGNKQIVELLLKAGKKNKSGRKEDAGALVNAALMGQVEIVRALLESGADPNSVGEEHFTALMAAVRADSIELVNTLVRAGADVNALNERGETALDLAYDNIKAAKVQAKFLKMMNDNPDAETREAMKVFARGGKEDEMTKVLKEAGGKLGKELKGKRSPQSAELKKEQKIVEEVEIPDFSKRAKQPEFQEAIEEVAKLTGKQAKVVTNEEGEPLSGCVSFQVSTEMADKILEEHHEKFLRRGCYLLKSQRGYTSGKDTLTLLPTAKRGEVLAAFQTNGANSDVFTADVIRWLDEMEKSESFVLTGAGFDWCEGRFTKPIADSKKLAKQMYEFCPDIVNQGTGDVARLALELKKSQRFFFWWD